MAKIPVVIYNGSVNEMPRRPVFTVSAVSSVASHYELDAS